MEGEAPPQCLELAARFTAGQPQTCPAAEHKVLEDAHRGDVEGILMQHRIRHLPVAGEEGLLGMLSIGDLNAFRADADHQAVEYLTEYIYGKS